MGGYVVACLTPHRTAENSTLQNAICIACIRLCRKHVLRGATYILVRQKPKLSGCRGDASKLIYAHDRSHTTPLLHRTNLNYTHLDRGSRRRTSHRHRRDPSRLGCWCPNSTRSLQPAPTQRAPSHPLSPFQRTYTTHRKLNNKSKSKSKRFE